MSLFFFSTFFFILVSLRVSSFGVFEALGTGPRRLGIESQSWRCSSAGVKTTVVCWRVRNDSGVIVLYGVKGHMFHKGSNVAKKIDAWIQKELRGFTIPRLYSCVQREQRVQHLHENKENKIDVMPLSGDSESVGLPVGSEPARPENPNPEVPGGARDPEVPRGYDPMRDDVDGDEAMVLRVPKSSF